MGSEFEKFVETFESSNTIKVVNSLQALGQYDYRGCTPVDIEQVILSLKPNSPKAITTSIYILSLYAKFLKNDRLYHIVQDLDRNVLWLMAKPNAPKKFISHSRFEEVYKDIEMYEDYNAFYQQTLFRCLYEGIYNDDMSVVKNLRASDVNGDIVTLREDNGNSYEIQVSSALAEDLKKLGNVDLWERRNRYGTVKITINGLYPDSCFKVENRKGSSEYSYRFTYYRILRKIAKEYLEYNLLPLQLYVSGIMFRIGLRLQEHGISLEEAFAPQNKNRIVNKAISWELNRCNCNTEVRNFREIVKGHIDVFCR